MMQFNTIAIEKDRETVIRFRKDSFLASFGEISGFGQEADYLEWLEEKVEQYPKGFVLVTENNKAIGQLELSIREYNGKHIGYVHLYYLIPEKRGMGLAKELHQYALNFFKENHLHDYHLRVAPANKRAIQFYKKNGMEEIGPEVDGKVIRMKGKL